MKLTTPALLTTLLTLTSLLPTTIHCAKVTNPSKPPRNAVLLSKVSALTFRANQQTTHRRVPSVPQLICLGPSHVCALYAVDTIRCTNQGADYDAEDIQWECRASLPDEFKLGSTDVVCEGYESSEDPWVLKGSCAVEYRLLLTERGEERFGGGDKDELLGRKTSWADMLGVLFFVAVVALMVWAFFRAWRDGGNNPRTTGGGSGGSGYNGGDDNDPPPPYSRGYSAPRKTTPRTYGTSSGGAESWRPGFWSGATGGAAAGYAAGRYANRDRGSSSSNNASSSRSSAGPSYSSPSFSSTRHESTGFGSTSRR